MFLAYNILCQRSGELNQSDYYQQWVKSQFVRQMDNILTSSNSIPFQTDFLKPYICRHHHRHVRLGNMPVGQDIAPRLHRYFFN